MDHMSILSVQPGFSSIVFETGYSVFNAKGLAIIWMSVGNSHFNAESIDELMRFAADHFSKVRVLVPYQVATHTFLALGYPENKAKTKAKLHSNRLTNHATRSIELIKKQGVEPDFQIVDWNEEVLSSLAYTDSLSYIQQLYQSNTEFKKDARETTVTVLQTKIKSESDLDQAIDLGVPYLLEELAFVLASPEIFHISKTAYVYHNKWPIYEKLVNGVYDQKVKENVGFLLVH